MVHGLRMLAEHSQGELESNGMACGALWSSCGEMRTMIVALGVLVLSMKGRGALEEAEPILGKS